MVDKNTSEKPAIKPGTPVILKDASGLEDLEDGFRGCITTLLDIKGEKYVGFQPYDEYGIYIVDLGRFIVDPNPPILPEAA